MGGGGGGGGQVMNSVECISPRGKRFHRLPNLSKPRSSTSTLVFEGKLAAINEVGDGGIQKMVEVLSVKQRSPRWKIEAKTIFSILLCLHNVTKENFFIDYHFHSKYSESAIIIQLASESYYAVSCV